MATPSSAQPTGSPSEGKPEGKRSVGISSSTAPLPSLKDSTNGLAAGTTPLIPLHFIDAPTQRVYIASGFLAVQAYKIYRLAFSLLDDVEHGDLGRLLLIDLAFVIAVSRLHTPRLDYTRRRWILLFSILAFIDWTAVGGYRVLLHALASLPILSWLSETASNAWSETFERQLSISEHQVRLRDIIRPKSHILGQHTIHLLPHSSASFLPVTSSKQSSRKNAIGAGSVIRRSAHDAESLAQSMSKTIQGKAQQSATPGYKLPFEDSALDWYSSGSGENAYSDVRRRHHVPPEDSDATAGRQSGPPSYCIDASNPRSELQLPILFRNAEPHWLSYSITPLDPSKSDETRIVNITIPKTALIRSSKERDDAIHREDRLDLELEDAEDDDSEAQSSTLVRGQGADSGLRAKEQRRKKPSANDMVYNLPVKRESIGVIRLERVMDRHQNDVRLSRGEVAFVECPRMGFLASNKTSSGQLPTQHYCPGDNAVLDVWVKGIPPMEMSYRKVQHSEARSPQVGAKYTISQITGSAGARLEAAGDFASQRALLDGVWAVPQNLTLPLTLDMNSIGQRTYVLEEVQDALGNVFQMNDEAAGAILARDIDVHARPVVTFDGCSSLSPISLLKNGPSRDMAIQVSGGGDSDGPYEARVRFEGSDGQTWTRGVNFASRRTTFKIDQPGSYSLEGIQGAYCAGQVGAQWLCLAKELPMPTANISFDPIKDQCAGSVGVKALAELSGSPPFRVRYEVKRQGKAVEPYERTIERTREEIEFRPTTEGEVTYSFKGLSDANYRDIPLQGPTFTQVLHPVATAVFRGGQGRKAPSMIVYSCEGNRAKAGVQLSGVGPFQLSYAIRSATGEMLGTHTVKDIVNTNHDVDFVIPPSIADRGGTMTVTLTKVVDSKGCERPLTVPDLFVNVQRTKPTAAFVDPRESTMLEDREGQLPLRLSGEGPWTIKYAKKGDPARAKEIRVTQAEAHIVVDKDGDYELREVRDAHCPGIVLAERSTHIVRTKPRPRAYFTSPTANTRQDTLLLKPVCAGSPDVTDLHVQGHFPVQITYRHQHPGIDAKESTFSSAQNLTAFRLRTDKEGKHYYALVRLGDTVYGPQGIGASSDAYPIKLEQQVLPLPKATYKATDARGHKVSLCQGESLNSEARRAILPVVNLEGTPPFTVEFAVKDSFDVVRKQLVRRGINTHEYKLDVDSFEFKFDKPGKWSVELTRISDGNGCERIVDAPLATDSRSPHRRTLDVDIVEAANISPVGTRDDYCVGESIDFILQGTPPFTVTYDFEGHKSHATSKKTIFSRVAERPGTLRVEAVAHQHNRCKKDVDSCAGLTKTIHELPSVHIRGGSHYIEDLREGNQAEIAFQLSGEPPFSFTYQRKQAVDRFSRPQVLETHTVTGIMGNTHMISTSEEGTWSVVWLQDKWCSVSLSTGASKSTSYGEGRQQGCVAPAVG